VVTSSSTETTSRWLFDAASIMAFTPEARSTHG
jgi:hypothetical protein